MKLAAALFPVAAASFCRTSGGNGCPAVCYERWVVRLLDT